MKANSKHVLIAFWNLKNTSLAKHLDSTQKKIAYAIFKDCMIISRYQWNSQLTFTSSKVTLKAIEQETKYVKS